MCGSSVTNNGSVTLNGKSYYVAISGQHFTSCSTVCSAAGKTCSDTNLRNFVTDFKTAYPTGNPYSMLSGMRADQTRRGAECGPPVCACQ